MDRKTKMKMIYNLTEELLEECKSLPNAGKPCECLQRDEFCYPYFGHDDFTEHTSRICLICGGNPK